MKAGKKNPKQAKTIEIKDMDAAKASADPKGGLNFTKTLLPAVQMPTDQITDGTSNTITDGTKITR